jgi:hypothetical protein
LKKSPGIIAGPKEVLDVAPQSRITAASFGEVSSALASRQSSGRTKHSHFAIIRVAH